jgi:hypothetical protein
MPRDQNTPPARPSVITVTTARLYVDWKQEHVQQDMFLAAQPQP